MVSCSISKCGNSSHNRNYSNNGITFHCFPSDPDIKDKWITMTGKKNWFPNSYSRICSAHFIEDDFNPTTKRRTLFKSAVPTINIWKLHTKVSSDSMTSGSSLPITSTERSTFNKSSTSLLKRMLEVPTNQVTSSKNNSDTAQTNILHRVIVANQNVIAKQRLIIKRLQCRTRRYKKKILELKDLLKNFEDTKKPLVIKTPKEEIIE